MATDRGTVIVAPESIGRLLEQICGGGRDEWCFSSGRAGPGFLLTSGHGQGFSLSHQRRMFASNLQAFVCAWNVTSIRSSAGTLLRSSVSWAGPMPRTGAAFRCFEFQP